MRHLPTYLDAQQDARVRYHPLDVDAWMLAQLLRTPAPPRLGFYSKLYGCIAEDRNAPEDLKRLWRDLEGPVGEGGPASAFAQDVPT